MIKWSVQVHKEVSSTQKILKILADEGLPQGTVVQALRQSAGRGRHGREWISQEGNLFLSFLLRGAQEPGKVALAAGVAAAQAINGLMGGGAELKWPNDVLIDGKKCAGILIERHEDAFIVGIGVNVASAPEGAACAGGDMTGLRDAFLSRFASLHEMDFNAVKDLWLGLAHPAGTKVMVKTGDIVREGVFEGLDMHGNMVMDTGVVSAGDVFLCS